MLFSNEHCHWLASITRISPRRAQVGIFSTPEERGALYLHDAKREVIIYDYVDMSVPVLAGMAAKRRVGYQTIGYRILGTGDLFPDQSVASEASGEAPATFSV